VALAVLLAASAGPLLAGEPTAAGAPGREAAAAAPAGPGFAHFRVGQRNVKALLVDGPLLWVGTSGGLVRYHLERDEQRLFDLRSGLLSNGIFHLSKRGGELLVGTYGGGLSLLDPTSGQWRHLNIQHGLADAFVYDVLQAADGDLWIATWSGLNRVRGGALFDRARWATYTVENTGGGLPNDWVYALERGANGALWLATEGGLARYQDGHWRHWRHADGLGAPLELVRDQIPFRRDPGLESSHHARQQAEQGLSGTGVAYNPDYVVSLLVDADGSVWAGTWGAGLAHFDGEHWHNYTVADGLPANHVFSLARATGGGIWVGTSHGLAHFDGQGFRVLTTADGLYADGVFAIAEAGDGSLWVGGYGGVARLRGLVGPAQSR
jgi:hypothetical protein